MRYLAQDAVRRLVTARFVASALADAFGAAPYLAVLTLFLLLLQSAFIARARRLFGSPWWRGWFTFTVV
jgi:hypothetical protein